MNIDQLIIEFSLLILFISVGNIDINVIINSNNNYDY